MPAGRNSPSRRNASTVKKPAFARVIGAQLMLRYIIFSNINALYVAQPRYNFTLILAAAPVLASATYGCIIRQTCNKRMTNAAYAYAAAASVPPPGAVAGIWRRLTACAPVVVLSALLQAGLFAVAVSLQPAMLVL